MSTDIVKYAFIAGEISPTLFGRTDLTKYDLAVAEGENFFVDYRGGLSSRPGFEFCDFVKLDTLNTRMFEFAFSPDLSNTYIVLFGDQYVRFIQDGAYVLAASRTVTNVTQASPAVVTSAAHGLSNGWWVKISGIAGMTELNSRTFEVRGVTTNTFQLYSVPDGLPVDSTSFGAYTSGGLAAPIYEIASPYDESLLDDLVVEQYRDLLRLTHQVHGVRNLVRNDHADWTLSEEAFGTDLVGPTITSGTGTAPDTGTSPPQKSAQVIFTVTSVDKDGDESVNGNLFLVDGIVNYTVFEGSVQINWSPVVGAVNYNVYRSVVASEGDLFEGSDMGYVGSTAGTSFTDPNITPDFARTPPVRNYPFYAGHVEQINITSGGSGFTKFTAGVTVSGGVGHDFIGQAVVGSDGSIVNVIIKNPGWDYSSPVVSFTGGSGATADAVLAPASGVYPAVSAIFQQRQIYAGTEEKPVTIWGSRYKRFSNFDSSNFVLDNDSFEFDLDTPAIAPIRHLITTRGGLLAFTQTEIRLLNGGGANEPLTPTNALADPQTYTGVTKLRPITIDSDILYREGKGYAVRLLSYNEVSKVYGGEDKSILSNHLFGLGRDITRWCYQESPFKVVWCVREDGALLCFTIVKPEDVFAWTPGSTRGHFVDCLAVREGPTDRVYVTTQRYINGRYTKFIERMSLRDFTNVEDAWCVDAGLSLGVHAPGADITIFHEGDVWYCVASTSIFSGADVGKMLRAADGIFEVTAQPSGVRLDLRMFEEPTNFIPQTDNSRTWVIPAGEWTLDEPVSMLSGLFHLEGETVSILGDGNVFPPKVVTNGQVTLEQPVTRAIVGLGYRCQAKSLPITVPQAAIEAKRKRVLGLGIRLDKSRGLKNGRSLDSLYEMRERSTEPLGRPTRLINGIKYQSIASTWDENGQTYFVLDDPLPVTILSLVFDVEVGDDGD